MKAWPNLAEFNLIESKLIGKAQLPLLKKYERMILDSQRSFTSHSVHKIFLDILDSISISELVPENATVCDVGSGQGFPGVPLAIVRRDLKIDLLEPNPKKYQFLRKVKSRLNLNVSVYCVRSPEWHKQYDVVVARRLGSLRNLYRLTKDLIASEGKLITFRSSNLARELRQVDVEAMKTYPRKHFNGQIVEIKWRKNGRDEMHSNPFGY